MDYKFILTAWDGDDAVSVDAEDDGEYLSEQDVEQMLKECEQALETKAAGWKLVRTSIYGDNEVVLQTEGEDEE